MIPLSEFEKELLKHTEIKNVVKKDEGLEVVIRQKIQCYDEDILIILLNTYKDGHRYDILSHLSKCEQEQRYFIGVDHASRISHKPRNAFCDPYMSMGHLEYDIHNGYKDGDSEKVVSALLIDTMSFNLSDSVMLERLFEWAESNYYEENIL